MLFVRLELLVLLAQSLKLPARLTHSDIALQQESGELHAKSSHLAARVLLLRHTVCQSVTIVRDVNA